ncbi:MAG: hypothetical protein GC206_09600 [Alphaproteobacteria bacterium]|nr:hypothetical protein [Alphaproteobacteria bacterium]
MSLWEAAMPSDALSLAFIDARPAAAARALAAMAPEQAAAFLEDIPARYAGQVAAHASAWVGASLLSRMTPLAAASVMRELAHDEAAAILRLMPADRRALLLEEASAPLRRALETSLSFPADSVGAMMTLAIIVLSQDETVADARAQAMRSPEAEGETIYIVDEERRLAGAAAASTLLRNADATPLREVMRVDVPALSARARLATAAAHEGWNAYAALPVLNRQRQVLGALTRRAAHAAAEALAHAPTRAPSISAQLMGAFAASTLELAALMTERHVDQSGQDTEA